MASVTVQTGGLPVLLGVLFIALKLCDIIPWSWWWVLSPFWIPFVLVLALAICAAIYISVKGL